MLYSITVRTQLARNDLERHLRGVVTAGPFVVQNLALHGNGAWIFTVQPSQPGLAVGFAKVAEFLLLLTRQVPIDFVERVACETQLPHPAATGQSARDP